MNTNDVGEYFCSSDSVWTTSDPCKAGMWKLLYVQAAVVHGPGLLGCHQSNILMFFEVPRNRYQCGSRSRPGSGAAYASVAKASDSGPHLAYVKSQKK